MWFRMASAADEDDVEWDAVGYVLSSKYRCDSMRYLFREPATPTTIATDEEYHISHVSRALHQLADDGLVELRVPEEQRKNRYYGLTDAGEELVAAMVDYGLVEDSSWTR